MDSFKDVLEAAQMYCKAQMAEPTYNLYIDGLEPISFEDSSHITLSVRNDFICKIVTPPGPIIPCSSTAAPALARPIC